MARATAISSSGGGGHSGPNGPRSGCRSRGPSRFRMPRRPMAPSSGSSSQGRRRRSTSWHAARAQPHSWSVSPPSPRSWALETGQEQIALGTYAMNRPLAETQSMFGFFSNPIMLAMRFDPKLSFRRWLARVREVVIETKARSGIPYDRLCEELHRSGTPPPEMSAMFQIGGRWPQLELGRDRIGPPRYTTRRDAMGIHLPHRSLSGERAVGGQVRRPDLRPGGGARLPRAIPGPGGGVLRKPRRRLRRQRP